MMKFRKSKDFRFRTKREFSEMTNAEIIDFFFSRLFSDNDREGHASGSWLVQENPNSQLSIPRESGQSPIATEPQTKNKDHAVSTLQRRRHKRRLIFDINQHRMNRDLSAAKRWANDDTDRNREVPVKKTKNDNVINWQRSFKPEPYPENTSPTERLGAWIDWKRQFTVSMQLVGELDQKTKANLLFMSIGNEIRRVIGACAMMKTEDEVDKDFAFYDHLMGKLEEYFRASSDTAIDLNVFSTMKQNVSEGAGEFLIRLRRQAVLCELQDATELLRNSFLKGMKDQSLAAQGIVGNWNIEKLVAAATRMEAWSDKPGSSRPWPMEANKTPVEVAAVTEERKGKLLHRTRSVNDNR